MRHRHALQRFRCTAEDLKMEVSLVGVTPTHPAMWEWQVQESIKGLRVPLKRRWLSRIGLTDDGRAGAFQLTQEIDRGVHYDLVYGAVAIDLQGRGLHIGDEMIADTLDVITTRCVALGVTDDVLLTTKVHRENRNSQKMCHRNGFRNQGSLNDDEYDDWQRLLVVAQPHDTPESVD